VVWDEGAPIPFLALAPSIEPGTVVRAHVNHYALLRTTQKMLGIRTPLGKAATARDLRPVLGI